MLIAKLSSLTAVFQIKSKHTFPFLFSTIKNKHNILYNSKKEKNVKN